MDIETLQMALIGYRAERRNIDEKITDLQHRVGGRAVATSDGAEPAEKRRKMSAAAIAHIRAAQKKRWAAFHEAQSAPASAKPKRKLSKAGRAAIVAALKKRWAAKKAETTKSRRAAPSRKKTTAKKAAIRRTPTKAAKRAPVKRAAAAKKTAPH
jgi:hypothetical protein